MAEATRRLPRLYFELDLKAFKLIELHLILYESIALGMGYNFVIDCELIGLVVWPQMDGKDGGSSARAAYRRLR